MMVYNTRIAISSLIFLILRVSQQIHADCPQRACCESDCCGGGSVYYAPFCLGYQDSTGWDGTLTPYDFDICPDLTCCESDCCGLGTTWDPITEYCLPTNPTSPTPPTTSSETCNGNCDFRVDLRLEYNNVGPIVRFIPNSSSVGGDCHKRTLYQAARIEFARSNDPGTQVFSTLGPSSIPGVTVFRDGRFQITTAAGVGFYFLRVMMARIVICYCGSNPNNYYFGLQYAFFNLDLNTNTIEYSEPVAQGPLSNGGYQYRWSKQAQCNTHVVTEPGELEQNLMYFLAAMHSSMPTQLLQRKLEGGGSASEEDADDIDFVDTTEYEPEPDTINIIPNEQEMEKIENEAVKEMELAVSDDPASIFKLLGNP